MRRARIQSGGALGHVLGEQRGLLRGLQKAPRRTDVQTMATSRLAAPLRLGSIGALAERSSACTTAPEAAADEGSTSASTNIAAGS